MCNPCAEAVTSSIVSSCIQEKYQGHKSENGTSLQKAGMFDSGDAHATAAMTSKSGVQQMYLEVTISPVGDKVQLILQATHIPQVVKCPTAAWFAPVNHNTDLHPAFKECACVGLPISVG